MKRAELMPKVRGCGWQSLLRSTTLHDELRHHCPCCGQWRASPSGLTAHLARNQPEWTLLRDQVLQRASIMCLKKRPDDTSKSTADLHQAHPQRPAELYLKSLFSPKPRGEKGKNLTNNEKLHRVLASLGPVFKPLDILEECSERVESINGDRIDQFGSYPKTKFRV